MKPWEQVIMYVRRDANGVIVRCEEKEPEGFKSELEWVQVPKQQARSLDTRYRPIGD